MADTQQLPPGAADTIDTLTALYYWLPHDKKPDYREALVAALDYVESLARNAPPAPPPPAAFVGKK